MAKPEMQQSLTALTLTKHFIFNDAVVFIALIFVVGGLFEPMAFQYTKFNFLLSVYQIDRSICFIGVVTAYLFFGKKDLFCLLVVLFSLSCSLSAYMNGESVMAGLNPWIPCIIIVLATATAYKNHFKQLLWAAFFVTFSLSCLNLLSMILYPDGLFSVENMPQNNYFLFGHRNASYKVFLPALGTAMALDYLSNRKTPIKTSIAFAISLTQVLLKFSATSLIAVIIFGLGALLINLQFVRKILNGLTYTLLYSISYFAIVIFRLQYVFADLFALFGKNVSLSGRTDIWDASLSLIANPAHRILGYSYQYPDMLASLLPARSAHNTVLDMLLITGWLGFSLLIAIVLIAAYRSYEKRTSKLCSCFSLAYGCLLVIGLTELVCSVWLFMMLAFMCYTPSSDENLPSSTECRHETASKKQLKHTTQEQQEAQENEQRIALEVSSRNRTAMGNSP